MAGVVRAVSVWSRNRALVVAGVVALVSSCATCRHAPPVDPPPRTPVATPSPVPSATPIPTQAPAATPIPTPEPERTPRTAPTATATPRRALTPTPSPASPHPTPPATPVSPPVLALSGVLPRPVTEALFYAEDARAWAASVRGDGTFSVAVPAGTAIRRIILTVGDAGRTIALDLSPADFELLRRGQYRVSDAVVATSPPATATPVSPGATPTPVPIPTQPMNGKATYSALDRMSLLETRTVDLVIGKDIAPENLLAVIESLQEARAEPNPVSPPIPIHLDEMRELEATLVSKPAGAFSVESVSAKLQRLDSNRISKWSWAVTARRPGKHTLELHLTAHFADGTWRELENFPRTLPVRVTALQIALAGLLLLLVAGVAFALRSTLRRAAEWVQKLFKKGVHVGDETNISGQQVIVGAVGKHARAQHIQIQQSASLPAGVDLQKLAGDLDALRAEMRKRGSESSHDIATAAVAEAHQSATAGDGGATMAHLKKAGQWALDVATSIGKTVVVDVIKKAMGM